MAWSACASQAQHGDVQSYPLVVLRPARGVESRVQVELARTPVQRSRGLMFRDRLDPDTGMLFVFEEESPQVFWMKNTYIPLDMIFITKDKRVLGVVERAEPLTSTPRGVQGASQFVLEVPGGYAKAHGIGPGCAVELVHVQ